MENDKDSTEHEVELEGSSNTESPNHYKLKSGRESIEI